MSNQYFRHVIIENIFFNYCCRRDLFGIVIGTANTCLSDHNIMCVHGFFNEQQI